MSRQHKQALAQGREQGRAIRRYLDALARQRPRRGRRRTVESANRQLRETMDQLATARSLARVELLQRRIDLEAEIAALSEDGGSELPELEADFVAAAKDYSERKGITTQAWLQGGVPRSVLRQAGLVSSRRGGGRPPSKGAAKTTTKAASRTRRTSTTRQASTTRRRATAKVSRSTASRRGRPAGKRSASR